MTDKTTIKKLDATTVQRIAVAEVVDRSRTVLEKLRDEQAVEAKGSRSGPSGTQQVVFDVETGEMRAEPVAGDGSGDGASAGDKSGASAPGGADTAAEVGEGAEEEVDETEPEREPLDPEVESVLEELVGTDINEVPPIELMAKVQEWQKQLDE